MRQRLQSEDGFTLIELLVVILIIGILAGIALPNFVSQRDRARDSAAKANVRNMETHVEACNIEQQDYAKCDTQVDLPAGVGIVVGSAPGDVEINAPTADSFQLIAHSTTGSTYSINKAAGTGAITRTCVVAPGKSDAGCKGGNW